MPSTSLTESPLFFRLMATFGVPSYSAGVMVATGASFTAVMSMTAPAEPVNGLDGGDEVFPLSLICSVSAVLAAGLSLESI